MNFKKCQLIYIVLLVHLKLITSFPQQGKWTLQLNDSTVGQYNGVAKNLYKGTKIFIRVNCEPTGGSDEISIGWILRETQVIPILSIKLRKTIGENTPEIQTTYTILTSNLQCWNDFAFIEAQQETVFKSYYEHPALQLPDSLVNTSANYLRYEHYHSDKE